VYLCTLKVFNWLCGIWVFSVYFVLVFVTYLLNFLLINYRYQYFRYEIKRVKRLFFKRGYFSFHHICPFYSHSTYRNGQRSIFKKRKFDWNWLFTLLNCSSLSQVLSIEGFRKDCVKAYCEVEEGN